MRFPWKLGFVALVTAPIMLVLLLEALCAKDFDYDWEDDDEE